MTKQLLFTVLLESRACQFISSALSDERSRQSILSSYEGSTQSVCIKDETGLAIRGLLVTKTCFTFAAVVLVQLQYLVVIIPYVHISLTRMLYLAVYHGAPRYRSQIASDANSNRPVRLSVYGKLYGKYMRCILSGSPFGQARWGISHGHYVELMHGDVSSRLYSYMRMRPPYRLRTFLLHSNCVCSALTSSFSCSHCSSSGVLSAVAMHYCD